MVILPLPVARAVSRYLRRLGRRNLTAYWARVKDRGAATAPGRAKFLSRFKTAEERSAYFKGLQIRRDQKRAAARKITAAEQEASASGRPAA